MQPNVCILTNSQSYKSFSPTLFCTGAALFFIFSLARAFETYEMLGHFPLFRMNFSHNFLFVQRKRLQTKMFEKVFNKPERKQHNFGRTMAVTSRKTEWMRNNARYVNVHINTIWMVFRTECYTHTLTDYYYRWVVSVAAANKWSLCVHTPASTLHIFQIDFHSSAQTVMWWPSSYPIARAYIIIGIVNLLPLSCSLSLHFGNSPKDWYFRQKNCI